MIIQNLWVADAAGGGYVGFLNNFETTTGGIDVVSDVGPNVRQIDTAVISNSIVKWGTNSAYLPVSGTPSFSTNSTGNITPNVTGRSWRLEFWLYVASGGISLASFSAVTIDGDGVIAFGPSEASTGFDGYYVGGSSSGPNTTGGFSGRYGGMPNFTYDTWHFYAIEKKWDDYAGFYVFSTTAASLAGVRIAPGVSTDYTDADLTDVNIGIGGFDAPLYMDSVRFMTFAPGTEDDLLYQTSGFTVPTGPFTAP